MRKLVLAAIFVGCVAGWAADYVADGGDPGRTGWIRNEKVFNKTNVKTMKLLWKTKLESTPRQMHSLFPPVILQDVTTTSGTKEIAIISGISDDLWAFDTATGKQLWHKHFDSTYDEATAGGRGGSTLCPGGQTAVPVVGPGSGPGKYTLYAVSWDGRLRQVNVADGEDMALPQKFMPPNAKPWSLNLVNGVIYTSNSQGCGGNPNAFYSFDLATKKASIFLPSGGGMWGRRGVAVAPDGTVYMGTGDGYYNAEQKQLGDSIVAVKEDANKELQLTGWFTPPNSIWMWHRDLDVNVSPMLIDYRGKHLLMGSSKECRVWLVDRDAITGTEAPFEKHQEMLDRTPQICNPALRYDAAGVWGAMATWIDPLGGLYIAVPFQGPLTDVFRAPIQIGKPDKGGVEVLKVTETAGKWHMAPVWSYGDIDQGDEAIYMNGMLWVNGAGEDTYQSNPDVAYDEAPRGRGTGQTGNRVANSRHATIYAFDATNGKVLWSSGDQITSWNHGSGMTAINGKAYIGTFDGEFYCFGIAK
jgi:hypothetical protein